MVSSLNYVAIFWQRDSAYRLFGLITVLEVLTYDYKLRASALYLSQIDGNLNIQIHIYILKKKKYIL
jgi:hypothetical protein